MARLKKTITVTILPGVTEKSRQWTFPRWAIYLFFTGVVALFSGIVLLIFFYSYETKKFMALQTIQEETRIQQKHLDNYRKKLDAIEAQLSEVNNLDAQIMNMVAKGAPDVHPPSQGEGAASYAPTMPALEKNALKSEGPAATPTLLPFNGDGGAVRYHLPVRGWIVSSFGRRTGPVGGGEEFHPGLDIAREEGTVVHSDAPGVVVLTDRTPDYGNYVIVYHGLGQSSLFAHLDSIDVVTGQAVGRETEIGTIGLTGLTTAPHLHYEVREFGHPVNPESYLASDGSDRNP